MHWKSDTLLLVNFRAVRSNVVTSNKSNIEVQTYQYTVEWYSLPDTTDEFADAAAPPFMKCLCIADL